MAAASNRPSPSFCITHNTDLGYSISKQYRRIDDFYFLVSYSMFDLIRLSDYRFRPMPLVVIRLLPRVRIGHQWRRLDLTGLRSHQ